MRAAQRRPAARRAPGSPAGVAGRQPAAARPRRRRYGLVSHDPACTVEAGAGAPRGAASSTRSQRVEPAVVLIELYPFGRQQVRVRARTAARRGRRAGAPAGRGWCAACATSWSRGASDQAAARRAGRPAGQRVVRRHPRARRPVVRPPRGVVPPGDPAAASRCTTPASSRRRPPAPDRRRAAAPACSSRPAAAWSASRCSRAAVAAHRAARRAIGLHDDDRGRAVPARRRRGRGCGPRRPVAATLDVVRRVDDLCAEIRRSALSVSQGGYNTTMDLLRAGTPAVVVPFADGTRGRADPPGRPAGAPRACCGPMPAPTELDGDRLVNELCDLAAFRPRPVPLDLTGRETSARDRRRDRGRAPMTGWLATAWPAGAGRGRRRRARCSSATTTPAGTTPPARRLLDAVRPAERAGRRGRDPGRACTPRSRPSWAAPARPACPSACTSTATPTPTTSRRAASASSARPARRGRSAGRHRRPASERLQRRLRPAARPGLHPAVEPLYPGHRATCWPQRASRCSPGTTPRPRSTATVVEVPVTVDWFGHRKGVRWTRRRARRPAGRRASGPAARSG